MATLHLHLKRKWFEMIKAGVKLEEYREIKPHYIRQWIKFKPACKSPMEISKTKAAVITEAFLFKET